MLELTRILPDGTTTIYLNSANIVWVQEWAGKTIILCLNGPEIQVQERASKVADMMAQFHG